MTSLTSILIKATKISLKGDTISVKYWNKKDQQDHGHIGIQVGEIKTFQFHKL